MENLKCNKKHQGNGIATCCIHLANGAINGDNLPSIRIQFQIASGPNNRTSSSVCKDCAKEYKLTDQMIFSITERDENTGSLFPIIYSVCSKCYEAAHRS